MYIQKEEREYAYTEKFIYVHRFVSLKFTNTEFQVDMSGTTQESSKRQ